MVLCKYNKKQPFYFCCSFVGGGIWAIYIKVPHLEASKCGIFYMWIYGQNVKDLL